jgi:tetratricopeptide (TPR) repeat protein
MSPWFILLLLWSALTCIGAAPEQSAARLRSLAQMPKVTINLQITSFEAEHPERMLGRQELERRIASLKAELKAKEADGARWLELGRYLSAMEQNDEAKLAYGKAAKQLRAPAEANPRNVRLQTELADALWQSGGREEAERLFRAVAKEVPDSWLAWTRLAEFCQAGAIRGIVASVQDTNASPGHTISLFNVASQLKLKPAAPEKWEDWKRLNTESQQCLERAAKLAPDEPEVLLRQALAQNLADAFLGGLLEGRASQATDRRTLIANIGSEAVCSAWGKLARRCPTNFAFAAYWGWVEASPGLYHYEGGKALDTLTEERRKNVLEALRMLEKIAGQGERLAAAGACESLSILRYMVTMEPERATADMRRAVELDPSREQAWDGLCVYAITTQNWLELVRVCEERVKKRDTARNRVLLAKAYEKAGQLSKGLDSAERALALDNKNVPAQLAVAALLARVPGEETKFERAIQILQGTGRQLHEVERTEEARTWTKTYFMNAAIFYALDGQKEEARKFLKSWDEVFGDDPEGREQVNEIALAVGK